MKNVNILKDLKTLNKLHAPSVESHTTNNSIVDFTCDNAGYVDNVVIEGETLVNLATPKSFKITTSATTYFVWFIECQDMTLNKTVTVFNFSDKVLRVDIRTGNSSSSTFARAEKVNANSSKVISLSGTEFIQNFNGALTDGWSESDKSNLKVSCVILEGDHTDKSISYFEGLKSVGQEDKIKVLTYKRDSENLASNLTFTEGKYVVSIDGGIGNNVAFKHSNEYIEVEGGCEYLFDNINGQFAIYDSSKSVIPTNWVETQDSWFKGDNYQSSFIYAMPKNAKYVRINLPISNLKPYSLIKTKSDIKQIPVTLRSLPNGVKDTIEKRGNKYVKVQRCGEVTLDGNENWVSSSTNSNEYANFVFYVLDLPCFQNMSKGSSSINRLCDKFIPNGNTGGANNSGEGLHIGLFGNSNKYETRISIDKTKLSKQDTEGFKTWLQSNPITVVYELETPTITELPNFNPQTYKGDNTLLLNSGVIQCDASFDVCEGIRSELDVIKDKVSSLDDNLSENVIDIKSKVTFLNGWSFWGNEERFNVFIVGNMVKMCILLSPGTRTMYTPIFKMPTEYAPITREYITCSDQANGCYVGCLDTDGLFYFEVNVPDEAKWTNVNITYPLGKKVF